MNGGAFMKIISMEKVKSFLEKIKPGKNTKRNLTVICSLLLIGAAIALNFTVFSQDNPQDSQNSGNVTVQSDGENLGDATFVAGGAQEVSDGGYFSAVQISRQRARDEAMETLLLVVDSQDVMADAKDEAYEKISKIAANIENEANVEALIMAKGFENCVAVINDNSASIIVKSSGLLPNEVAQIQEIVCEHSGLSAQSITIIETEN